LQQRANQTGMSITVCHFPPGTSKWNKIECIVSIEVRHSAFGYNDGFGEGRRGNQGTQVPPPAPPPSFFPLAG